MKWPHKNTRFDRLHNPSYLCSHDRHGENYNVTLNYIKILEAFSACTDREIHTISLHFIVRSMRDRSLPVQLQSLNAFPSGYMSQLISCIQVDGQALGDSMLLNMCAVMLSMFSKCLC